MIRSLSPILILALVFSLAGCSEYQLSAIQQPLPDPVDEAEVPEEEAAPEEEPEDEPPLEDETPVEDEPPAEEPPAEEPPPEGDCEDSSDLVYVIDRDSDELFLFDPENLSYELLGELDCGLWAGSPASMSVSRDGMAYVRYSDDSVYRVDLETMDCAETPYGEGFGHFGMGFATEAADSWQDDLYVANSSQLARLDHQSWSLEVLGNLPSQSELTGNADGELWAMLPLETPAKLALLDKEDASILQTISLPSFPDPYSIDTFAFASWGGDFWLFVRSYGMGETTNVYRVDSQGDLTLVWEDSGHTIVGAGVSTCAPTD